MKSMATLPSTAPARAHRAPGPEHADHGAGKAGGEDRYLVPALQRGLQLLAEGSDESPDTQGLGVLPGRATRLPRGVRVPHLGWNRVEPDADCRLLRPGHAYFAHSFYLAEAPTGWAAARTTHGRAYVSAFERGPVLACQFHPELSGAWGLDLLRRWLEA